MLPWKSKRHGNVLPCVPMGRANDPKHAAQGFFHPCTFVVPVRRKVATLHDAKRVWVHATKQ